MDSRHPSDQDRNNPLEAQNTLPRNTPLRPQIISGPPAAGIALDEDWQRQPLGNNDDVEEDQSPNGEGEWDGNVEGWRAGAGGQQQEEEEEEEFSDYEGNLQNYNADDENPAGHPPTANPAGLGGAAAGGNSSHSRQVGAQEAITQLWNFPIYPENNAVDVSGLGTTSAPSPHLQQLGIAIRDAPSYPHNNPRRSASHSNVRLVQVKPPILHHLHLLDLATAHRPQSTMLVLRGVLHGAPFLTSVPLLQAVLTTRPFPHATLPGRDQAFSVAIRHGRILVAIRHSPAPDQTLRMRLEVNHEGFTAVSKAAVAARQVHLTH